MAKVIKYNLCTKVNHGTEETPQWEEILSPVEMGWNETNEEIAQREAYNGEYTIEDDGEEETPAAEETSVYDEMAAAYNEGVQSA